MHPMGGPKINRLEVDLGFRSQPFNMYVPRDVWRGRVFYHIIFGKEYDANNGVQDH